MSEYCTGEIKITVGFITETDYKESYSEAKEILEEMKDDFIGILNDLARDFLITEYAAEITKMDLEPNVQEPDDIFGVGV